MARLRVYENPQSGHMEKVKDGFNWPAFFLGPFWYLFNNMVARGLGWFLVAVLAGSFTFGLGGVIVWIVAGVTANNDISKRYLQGGWKLVGYEEDGDFTPTNPSAD